MAGPSIEEQRNKIREEKSGVVKNNKQKTRGGAYKGEHTDKSKYTSFKKSIKPGEKRRKRNKIDKKSEYRNKKWYTLRKKVLERDNYTCVVCKLVSKKNYVHHWRYQGNHVWDTDMMFLATVCKECHEKIHLEESREDI